MHRKSVKAAKRAVFGAMSAVFLFSGMNMNVLAKDTTGLPAAGIDYFLSSNPTSVKNLKDEEDEKKASASDTKDNQSDIDNLASALPTATATATASPETVAGLPFENGAGQQDKAEEKVIEETVIATTTKTVSQMDRKL